MKNGLSLRMEKSERGVGVLKFFHAYDHIILFRNFYIFFFFLIFLTVLFSSCSLAPYYKKDKMNRDKKSSSSYRAYGKDGVGQQIDSSIRQDSQDSQANFSDENGEVPLGAADIGPDEQHEKMKSNMQEIFTEDYLDEQDHRKLVQQWMTYFTRGQKEKDRFIRHFQNGEKYKNLVQSIFEQYRLPPELFYVGLIESGYNLKIKSRAQAVGPWQFMTGTALRYGLQVNDYVDERRSIFKSTHAAALYLKDLYNIFGDWALALAAYNSGEYKVLNAIRNGKTRNYKELSTQGLLPRETRSYLPKLIAAKKIIEEWHQPDPESESEIPTTDSMMENYPFYTLTFNTSLNKIVELGKIPRDVVLDANPDIKGDYIQASPSRPYRLYLPESYLQILTSNFQNGPTVLLSVELRPSKKWSKTTKIAEVKTRQLAMTKVNVNSGILRRYKSYIVKKGDNLFKIASRFNVPIRELISINSLDSKLIFPRQKILIPFI